MTDALETPEFRGFPKLARLNRDVVISEKIDGTHAAIGILQDGTVFAQSRKRIIKPGKDTDNFGFAGWVDGHADLFRESLPPGFHYGEWWGQGIQRGYSLEEKRFSLFNPETELSPELLEVLQPVPVLYHGPFRQEEIFRCEQQLLSGGSVAAPWFMQPEGIVIYHTAARIAFKVTLIDDGIPKSVIDRAIANDPALEIEGRIPEPARPPVVDPAQPR